MENTTLTRTLRLPSLVLFGLAYLTPIIVLGIFGIIAETTGGAAPAGQDGTACQRNSRAGKD